MALESEAASPAISRGQHGAAGNPISSPDEIRRNLHVSVEVFDNATGKTTFTEKFCTNNL